MRPHQSTDPDSIIELWLMFDFAKYEEFATQEACGVSVLADSLQVSSPAILELKLYLT